MELRGTLQCIEWINNQDLLSSTGNYIYYIVITYDERESRIIYVCVCVCVSLVAQVVQNLPAMQET